MLEARLENLEKTIVQLQEVILGLTDALIGKTQGLMKPVSTVAEPEVTVISAEKETVNLDEIDATHGTNLAKQATGKKKVAKKKTAKKKVAAKKAAPAEQTPEDIAAAKTFSEKAIAVANAKKDVNGELKSDVAISAAAAKDLVLKLGVKQPADANVSNLPDLISGLQLVEDLFKEDYSLEEIKTETASYLDTLKNEGREKAQSFVQNFFEAG